MRASGHDLRSPRSVRQSPRSIWNPVCSSINNFDKSYCGFCSSTRNLIAINKQRNCISKDTKAMASQTTCSKPQTSPRLRMASLSNQVAVLDMKLAEVRPLDKAEVEDKEYPSVDIPRWKNNVHIYLPREDDGGKQFIAKVNFRRHPRIPLAIPIREPQYLSDEEGPWSQKTVLAFDGGGIRGYSSLLILKRIMLQIRRLELEHEEYQATSSAYYPWKGGPQSEHVSVDPEPERIDEYLPCHYFDYMAGTSTGGLSSLMLGRLRMSVDEALDEYSEFGNAVFGKSRWFHERSLLWYPRAKFSCRKTREAFQGVVLRNLRRERGHASSNTAEIADAINEPLKYREDRTRTIAVSLALHKGGGRRGRLASRYVWRSYDNNFTPKVHDPKRWNACNMGPAHTATIWEVARATTAAPVYFESIKIGSLKHLDGGMAANNPSLTALEEIYGQYKLPPALFVSLGTGLKPDNTQDQELHGTKSHDAKVLRRAAAKDDVRRKQFLKKYVEIGRQWKSWIIDTEGDNGVNGWRFYCEHVGTNDSINLAENAHRLNVDGELHTIPLDDWRPANTGEITLKSIEKETDVYLRQDEVMRDIESIARRAVEIRRQRALYEKWETFAVDVAYYCKFCPQKSRRLYDTRAALRQHLEDSRKHNGSDGLNVMRIAPDEIEEALTFGRTLRNGNHTAASNG
ncbi:hypothetical protein NM208_g9266 [Fusarium decemcellulare]|uniref:Uncharacterized protein n=1 Tax=Fusarium decemcellulare TaxID=57161 RepID=A0ACC1S269_9HYPO|nr:hypothetical protein NM208_g9266 [Fusarium decemcellulare]